MAAKRSPKRSVPFGGKHCDRDESRHHQSNSKMVQVYLYVRMYYNKIRKQCETWWSKYLLCKCCVLIVPLYTLLLTIGAYCIIYQVNVSSPVKTIYEVILLFLSAGAIFTVVLLLATLNNIYYRTPPQSGDNDLTPEEILEYDISLRLEKERKARYSSSKYQQDEPSWSYSIMSSIFGNYRSADSDDDMMDANDEDLIEKDVVAMMNSNPYLFGLPRTDNELLKCASMAPNVQLCPLPHNHSIVKSEKLPTVLVPGVLNRAQANLVSSIEQTVDNLEHLLDECDELDLDNELSSDYVHSQLHSSSMQYHPALCSNFNRELSHERNPCSTSHEPYSLVHYSTNSSHYHNSSQNQAPKYFSSGDGARQQYSAKASPLVPTGSLSNTDVTININIDDDDAPPPYDQAIHSSMPMATLHRWSWCPSNIVFVMIFVKGCFKFVTELNSH